MPAYRSDFLHQAAARGFIYQGTDLEALDEKLCQGPVTAYVGFDASAPSLHVGSLVVIMLMRLLQQTGHRPLILLGEATTKIGDPSGKDAARQILTDETIQQNMDSLSSVFSCFLTFPPARFVNNKDWFHSLKYLDFLQEMGRYFSVNRMLSFDSVRLRLERQQPLSFLEFNYMLLQSYDFLQLFQAENCCLQVGGADQWGNIVSGVDLIRRMKNATAFGLTCPLMTTATGAKMGKTAQGAVWLNPNLLKPYDYWQFWRNTHDADVGRFLKLFTAYPLEEIARLETCQGAELNEAKKILADEATKLLHGPHTLLQIHQTVSDVLVQQPSSSLMPTWEIPEAQLKAGVLLIECLEKTGLASSKSEARRFVRSSGVRLDHRLIQDELHLLKPEDFRGENFLRLSWGRKKQAILKIGFNL